MTERSEGSGVSTGRKLNRREFLKMGGAGLAGAALLGATGCGGGSGGSGNLIFSMGPDDAQGTMAALIKKFNEQSDFNVVHRVMPSDTGIYFDKLRTQLQAGSGGVDATTRRRRGGASPRGTSSERRRSCGARRA